MFHVLSARQVTLYMYLNMLGDATGVCHPTSRQIQQDLGLSSLTSVFEALSALETRGFILRQRRSIPGHASRQNVYQRPACEYTILRLLQDDLLDESLCPTAGVSHEMSDESCRLKDEWLRNALAADYDLYRSAAGRAKRSILMVLLRRLLDKQG